MAAALCSVLVVPGALHASGRPAGGSPTPAASAGELALSWGDRGAVSMQLPGSPGSVAIRPESVGSSPVSAGPFVADGGSVSESLGGGVTAWYRRQTGGLEQGFTLTRRPLTSDGHPSITLAVTGSRHLTPVGATEVVLSTAGGAQLTYGGLRVTDARGTVLPSHLSTVADRLVIGFDDRAARYPVTVDPYIVPSATPVATFTAGAGADLGQSAALSADGHTALVGAPNASAGDGAAYLFVQSGGQWPATPTATFTGPAGSHDMLGTFVALSADGSTALVSGGVDNNVETADLYTAASGWATPVAVFSEPTVSGLSGSLALSGDGQTALFGVPGSNAGDAVYVYAASGGTWSTTPVLTIPQPIGTSFGSAVALSMDGRTALIGAPYAGTGQSGLAYVYSLSSAGPAGWSATTTATYPGTAGQYVGWSVALSSDGATALIGAPAVENGAAPVVYLATASAGVWPSQPQVTFPTVDGVYLPSFGFAVALSGDGRTALIGTPVAGLGGSDQGAAYLYTEAPTWSTTPAQAFPPQSMRQFGRSTALSSDGEVALIGANADAGAAYVFAAAAAATAAPAFTSPASAATGMRVPFSDILTTTGTPTAAISESGPLPAGITLTDNGDGTATLAGTAAAGSAGSYPITLSATNGVGGPVTQAFVLTVTTATSAPAFTSAGADTETFGVPYTFTVTTTGYPAPKITRTGSQPAGVTFADNGNGTATFSGTPTRSAVGVYPLTLTAKSSAGTVTQSFSLTITKAPVIKKIPNTTAHVGSAVQLPITVSGYTTPAITESGTLPAGVTFADNQNGTAAVTGVPATGSGGTYAITITATNPLGAVSQTFTLTVDEAPTITSPGAANAHAGTAFTFTVTASGYPAPRIAESGQLPAGVTFKNATATFSGTPKAAARGTYTVAVTATNSTRVVTQSLTITVT